MELSEQEREEIHRIAEATNRRNRRARERAGRAIAARKEAAWKEVRRLVQEFQALDPELRRVVVFGSLATGRLKRVEFDIDMAVDSDRYLALLGPALDSPFKVDLVDLPQARSHIREAILRDGVEVFRAE
jgi:predicted nucleotidyltransferase